MTAQPPRTPLYPRSSERGCLVEPGGGPGWGRPPWHLWDMDSGPCTRPGPDSTGFHPARPGPRPRGSEGSSWLLGLFPLGLLCAPRRRLLACLLGGHSPRPEKRLQRSLDGEGPGRLLLCWPVPQFPQLWGKQRLTWPCSLCLPPGCWDRGGDRVQMKGCLKGLFSQRERTVCKAALLS